MKKRKEYYFPINNKQCYSKNIFHKKINLFIKKSGTNKKLIKKSILIVLYSFNKKLLWNKLQNFTSYSYFKIINFSNYIHKILQPFLYIKFFIYFKQLQNKILTFFFFKTIKKKKRIIIIRQENLEAFSSKKFLVHNASFNKKKLNWWLLLNNIKIINKKKLKEKKKQNLIYNIINNIHYSYSYFDFFSNYLTNNLKYLELKSKIKKLKKKNISVLSRFLFLLSMDDLTNFKPFADIRLIFNKTLKISFSQNVKINKKIKLLKKNQYYFYYLLKKNLSEIKFNMFNRSNINSKLISVFRYLILNKLLKMKISKKIFTKVIQELIILNSYRI